MNHLNEDTLIQYAFDLMDAESRLTADTHLDQCSDCQKALNQLKTKFAAMDALNSDQVPSEALIRQTLTVKDKAKVIPLYRRRWVEWSAAAAAVALVCFLLLQNLPDTPPKEPTRRPSTDLSTVAKLDAPEKPAQPESLQSNRAVPFPDDRMASLGTEGHRIGETALIDGVRVVNANQIPDSPPFAPASAIELVVLPKPDKTQITIYNSADLTLVRDTRKLTLKPGWNWLQFMWDQTLIDPTSLSLTPLGHEDKIEIQQLVYPARLKDIGRWLIRSEVEGAVPFEITYFASGLSWRAFYMGTMNEDETKMDLKGYVNVSNNSGQDFVNTQTRLIVGQTRLIEEIAYLAQRHYPYGPDIVEDEEGLGMDHALKYNWREKFENEKASLLGDMSVLNGLYAYGDVDFYFARGAKGYDIKQIEKTGLSEYFLYTIEGTEDLPNTWAKRLPSFNVQDIPVKSLYKYDENRYGKQAVRFVSFANDAEHELGDTPIPEGSIKIYRNVNNLKNLSYVGQSNIKYIPVNEDIELNLGLAQLIKVEPILIKQKTENYTFDDNGNIDGWDDIETYKVTIINTRDIPIDIEITWNMGTDAWELTYADMDLRIAGNPITYKKHDKSRGRFTLTVPPKSEKVFEHTIRKYRQKRTEAYVQKMQEQKK